jgi:hypothetical protein
MLNSTEGSAQIYFDNLYGEPNYPNGIGTGGTLLMEGGYLCWAIKNGDDDAIYILAVNEYGQIISEAYPPQVDSISEMSGSVHKLNDTLFLGNVFRQDRREVNQGDPELVWFNPDGSYFLRRFYGLPERTEIIPAITICMNASIAMGGQVMVGQNQNLQGDGYLEKIDSNGIGLWSQSYGGPEYDGFQSILQTPDSGFLLLGWTRSYGAGQRDFYLVKTDSVGNQLWQKTYGGSGDEGGSCIIALNDGNYLLTGGGWNATATGSVGRLYKIDPSGVVIWAKTYEHDPDNYLFKSIELQDGSIVSTGLTNNTDDAGWLLKTDADGNELWQRKYNKNNNTDLFYSVLLANDGGFLLSGQARNAETNSQDAWLLKVDSVGCPYPDCLVGVDEAEPTKVVVDVWPNPAGEYVRLQVTGNRSQQEASVWVTDMQGHTIQPEYEIASEDLAMTGLNGQYLEIDVRNWSDGLYIFTINNGTERARVRVVVQH